jgi:hypothetical protein
VNKKKQKDFSKLGCAGFSVTGPEEQKFLRRFFQKSGCFPAFTETDQALTVMTGMDRFTARPA